MFTTASSGTKSRSSSTAKKLVQAAALTAVLVPLGTVAIEGDSISCVFGGATSNACAGGEGYSYGYSFSPNSARFNFINSADPSLVDYFVDLTFDTVSPTSMFNVRVSDIWTDQGEVEDANRTAAFPGYVCVTIYSIFCVDFEFDGGLDQNGDPIPLVAGPTTWTGFFTIRLHWAVDTNGSFPNDSNSIAMLHNRGDVPGNAFNTNITVPGSYESDPGISGRDDNFQTVMAFDNQAVPEPASLLLLGTGLGVLGYRRRWLLRKR